MGEYIYPQPRPKINEGKKKIRKGISNNTFYQGENVPPTKPVQDIMMYERKGEDKAADVPRYKKKCEHEEVLCGVHKVKNKRMN